MQNQGGRKKEKSKEKERVGKGPDEYGMKGVQVSFPNEQQLSQEEREFRQERRQNWPTAVNVERKRKEEEERKQRGELPKDTPARKRLRQVLAQQRRLGHHEATRECGRFLPPCKFFMRGKCRKGKKCPFSHDKRSHKLGGKRKRHSDSNKPAQPKGGANKSKGPDRGGLLRLLLRPQIRRERSHLLQALRFIVNNDFLQGGEGAGFRFFPWTPSEGNAGERNSGLPPAPEGVDVDVDAELVDDADEPAEHQGTAEQDVEQGDASEEEEEDDDEVEAQEPLEKEWEDSEVGESDEGTDTPSQ